MFLLIPGDQKNTSGDQKNFGPISPDSLRSRPSGKITVAQFSKLPGLEKSADAKFANYFAKYSI